MKPLKIPFLLACTIVALVGCLGNTDSEPPVVTEPMSTSYYYIANQSGSDLKVTYVMADIDMDSTVAVPVDSTTQIFGSAGISSSHPPSGAMEKISFYKLSDDTTSPSLTIEPVVDKAWDMTQEYEPGDAVKHYELVITGKDL